MIDDESREGMSDNRFKGHWEDRSIAILYDERPPPSYNQETDLNAEIYLGICNESLNMIGNLSDIRAPNKDNNANELRCLFTMVLKLHFRISMGRNRIINVPLHQRHEVQEF